MFYTDRRRKWGRIKSLKGSYVGSLFLTSNTTSFCHFTQDQSLPSDSWLVLPPPPTDPLAQTQNENCCKTYSFELLSVLHCLESSGWYSWCRKAHRWRVNHSHTSLFSIIRFHASDVGRFFGHQNFHEFREAVFKLSCCLGEKKENHVWRDDLQPVLVTGEQTSQSPSFKGKRLVFRLPC